MKNQVFLILLCSLTVCFAGAQENNATIILDISQPKSTKNSNRQFVNHDLVDSLMTYISQVSGVFSQDLKYNTQLKVPQYSPTIRFASGEKLYVMKNQILAKSEEDRNSVQGLYFYGGSIYLRDDWNAEDIGDQSRLLHELVHYLQDTNGLYYDCQGDKERLALYIQEKWLNEVHNISIYEALNINPLRMVANMMCPPSETLAKPGEGGP